MIVEITTLEQLKWYKGIKTKDIEEEMSRWTYNDIKTWKTKPSEASIEKLIQIFDIKKEEIIPIIKKIKW